MRALQVHSPTGPDSVVVAEVPEPDGEDALLVDVTAAGVGFADLLMTRGEFQIRQEPPFTLGWEAAGTVARAPAASPFQPGDRVVTMSFGSYAERVAAVPEATFPLPEALSFEEGAAYPLNYLTALAGLKRRGRLQAGESVLGEGVSPAGRARRRSRSRRPSARACSASCRATRRRRWRSMPVQRRRFGRTMTGASR